MSPVGLDSYIFGVVIIVVICAVMMRYLKNRRFNQLGSALPGPRCLPILGNMLMFTNCYERVVHMIDSVLNENPSICRLWMGPMLWVFTKDAEAAKIILVDHHMMSRGIWGDIFKTIFGDGLITIVRKLCRTPVDHTDTRATIKTIAELWQAKRKCVGVGFGSTFVREFVPMIYFHAKTLIRRMETHQNKSEFALSPVVSPCAFDAVFESMFHVRMNAAQSEGNDSLIYSKALAKLSTITMLRFLRIWLYPDFIFNRTSLGAQYKEYLGICDDFTHNIIRNKRESMLRRHEEEGTFGHEDDAPNPWAAKQDLLEILINWNNNGKRLSDRELKDEINTMSTAGLDSTNHTLCFLLLMLASHPDIQNRAYQELCQIFGNNVDDVESTITIHQLDRMEYLERVIKETMRVYPVVSFIPREATRDLYLGKHLVPKGATLFLSVFSLHRDAKHWPNPLKFDPDRFLPEEIEKRHRYAYLPFSAGPRNCIGRKYAMLTMKIMCSTVLRKYVLKKDNVTPLDNIQFRSSAIITPIGGVHIRIEPRIKK